MELLTGFESPPVRLDVVRVRKECNYGLGRLIGSRAYVTPMIKDFFISKTKSHSESPKCSPRLMYSYSMMGFNGAQASGLNVTLECMRIPCYGSEFQCCQIPTWKLTNL